MSVLLHTSLPMLAAILSLHRARCKVDFTVPCISRWPMLDVCCVSTCHPQPVKPNTQSTHDLQSPICIITVAGWGVQGDLQRLLSQEASLKQQVAEVQERIASMERTRASDKAFLQVGCEVHIALLGSEASGIRGCCQQLFQFPVPVPKVHHGTQRIMESLSQHL